MDPGHAESGVTRVELVEAVRGAFRAADSATRDELVAAAEQSGARGAVVALLRAMPAVTVRGPREMWAHLPDLPVQ